MTNKCQKCGSREWAIQWDPQARTWFCALRGELKTKEQRRAEARAKNRAKREREQKRTASPEPALPVLCCARCGVELLSGALPGVVVYCDKCRTWAQQIDLSNPDGLPTS